MSQHMVCICCKYEYTEVLCFPFHINNSCVYSIVYVVFFFLGEILYRYNLFNVFLINGHLGCFQAYAIEDTSAYTCLYCFIEICR